MALRVLIVDDHPSFRDLARRLLIAGGYDVVGSAADGNEALDQVSTLRPDVVLLDVLLPDLNGLDVAEQLGYTPNPPMIVLISSRSRVELTTSLADAPVLGFLAKDELTLSNLGALLQ